MKILLLAVALSCGAAATAQSQPQTAAPAPVAKGEEPKKICRRVVPTGSIMSQKVCRTTDQWRALSEAGQDTLRQVRDRSSATMGQEND